MEERNSDPPQRALLRSRAELNAALLLLLGRARQQLRIAAPDLSVLSLAEVEPVAILRRLLLARADSRVRLLVDDTAWLDARAPRLRSLQRDFSHALLIRRADAQYAVGETVVAVGDDEDVLCLQPTTGVTGEMWLRHLAFAQPFIAEFDRRWEHASHDLPVKPLGL